MYEKGKKAELYSCEKYIVEYEEGIYKRYGKNFLLRKRRVLRKAQPLISISMIFGATGFLFLYFILSLKSRKQVLKIYDNKIVFDDHRSKVIEKRIFDYGQDSSGNKIAEMLYKSSIFTFLSFNRLRDVLNSYRRTRPRVINAFFALCQFWTNYNYFSKTLPDLKCKGVLVVDDFSANRLALIMAAKYNGIYTGIVRLLDESERPCPFESYDILFCWNLRQSLEEKGKYKVCSHFKRTYSPIKELPVSGNYQYTIGVGLKSYFSKDGLIALLENLSTKNWLNEVVVRFHPGGPSTESNLGISTLKYKKSSGPVDSFLQRLDLLIAGSSSLIKDALMTGVPVIYYPRLDTKGGRDFYAYEKEGIVYSLDNGKIDQACLRELNVFYQGKKWQEIRDSWIFPDPEAVSPAEALKVLLND